MVPYPAALAEGAAPVNEGRGRANWRGLGQAMASLVYFRKVAESSDSIEYAFGPDASEMPRRLSMDTKSRRSRPVDGKISHEFLKASRKITAMYDETAQWPDRGMSFS